MLRRLFVFSMAMMLAVPAMAADSPLDALSGKVTAVVKLKAPKATIDKAASLVDAVQPGFGGQVRAMSKSMGVIVSNPKLSGADDSKDWFVGVYGEPGEGEPGVVFIVPAKDIAKMKKDVASDEMKFYEYKVGSVSYGVYTNNDAAAAATADQVKATSGLSSLIDAESKTAFEAGDVSVMVNIKGMLAAAESKLADAEKEALGHIEEVNADGIPEGITVDIPGAKALSTAVVKTFFQAVRDTDSVVFSLSVSKAGLGSETLIRFKKGGIVDTYLQKHPGSAFPTLGALPAQQTMYFAAAMDYKGIFSLLNKALGLVEVKGEEGPAAQFKAAKALLAEMDGLDITSTVSSSKFSVSDEGLVQSINISDTPDAAALRNTFKKITELTSAMQTPGIKQTFDYKDDAEKFGEYSADVLTMKMAAEDSDEPQAEIIQRISKLIYGEKGMTSRSVFLKNKVVQTTGGGKAAMEAALAAAAKKDASEASPAMQAIRKQLVEKPNTLMLIDLPGMIADMARIAATIEEIPFKIDTGAIDSLDLKESYMGFSGGSEPQGFRIKTYIPVEQAQGIAKIGFAAAAMAASQGNDDDGEDGEGEDGEEKEEKE